MIKAVFFDLYGTLAGFKPSREEIQSTACADFGITVAPQGILRGYALADAFMARQKSVKPLRDMDRDERRDFFAEYERLVLQGAGVEVTLAQASDIWRRIRQIPYGLARYDDVAPTLSALRERGLTIGLVSNIDNSGGEELTDSLGLTPLLHFAVFSSDVGAEKPHPPIFLAALDRAGVPPGEAMHVGDQPSSDVEGARGVGINPVLIDRDRNHVGTQLCPRIETL
ncbi:MAG: HAD-IA family hydrolase, partial [Chloroflexi bacterium]|nr:HAD-IA family hydrolase [Chloroflexota bacterium]